jgi:hypothetical protein
MKNATHEGLGATAALTVCVVVGADTITTGGCIAASLLGSRLSDVREHGPESGA